MPILGAFGASRLAVLYGPLPADPTLEILLRHRAVLFGLLGVLLGCAAFLPHWHWPGFVAAFVSVGTFLWLAEAVGGYGPAVARVVFVDRIVLLVLIVGAGCRAWADLQS